jgi:hypothetical protein
MALSATTQWAIDGTVDPSQVLLDGVIGGATAGFGAQFDWAPDPIPLGFGSRTEFNTFARELRAGLEAAGYGDIQSGIRGSSMTGVHFKDQTVLDHRGPRDFDLALIGQRIYEDAKALGIDLRQGKTRTDVLARHHLGRLGLDEVIETLQRSSGRKVSFMAYRDEPAIAQRGPYRTLP